MLTLDIFPKIYENLTPDCDILLIVPSLPLLVYSLFLLRPAPPLFAPNLVFVFARSAVCSQSFRPLPPMVRSTGAHRRVCFFPRCVSAASKSRMLSCGDRHISACWLNQAIQVSCICPVFVFSSVFVLYLSCAGKIQEPDALSVLSEDRMPLVELCSSRRISNPSHLRA